MTIQAIETRYAGCHFRSRLEARWAVFFDTLGIKWEYEPQGYTVGPDKRPYLPDFWLPDLNAFAEVKGDTDRLDETLLADLLRESGHALFVLVLGQLPYAELGRVPVHATFAYAFDTHQQEPAPATVNRAYAAIATLDKEDQAAIKNLIRHGQRSTVVCQRFVFGHGRGKGLILPISMPNGFAPTEDILNPEPVWFIVSPPKVLKAYEAARSARFEHGDAGGRVA